MCLSWITSLTYHICHISASWVLSTHRVRRYSTEVTLIVASWDHGSWWGKSGQHAPKYYSFKIMTVCVCSESVGKSPIPRARPAAARCVATRLSNTNVFWRHSELRQRQGFPTRHLSCSSSCPLNPRYQHPNVSVCVLATWTWSNTIYRQKSCWCLQSCWLRGYISTQPNR